MSRDGFPNVGKNRSEIPTKTCETYMKRECTSQQLGGVMLWWGFFFNSFFSSLWFPKRDLCVFKPASGHHWRCGVAPLKCQLTCVTVVGPESQSGTRKHVSWTPSHRSIPALSTPAPIGASIMDGDSPPAPLSGWQKTSLCDGYLEFFSVLCALRHRWDGSKRPTSCWPMWGRNSSSLD